MATDEQMPKLRNALTWAVVGFIVYGLVMTAAVSVLHRGGLAAALGSRSTLAILAAALLVATVAAGLGQRNFRVGPRTLRNFLVWTGTALAIFGLVMWGIGAFAGRASLKAMGVSATTALWVGLVLFFLAVLGLLHVAAARTRTHLLTAEQSEAILDRIRALSYSLLSVAALGLTLVVLSLAGPRGPLPAISALAIVLVLLGFRAAMGFASRPLGDELSRTVSREAGHAAFRLIVVIGGGWAILAHLGFVPEPAPLDWLTMFTVSMFAASFIAAGKRGLLKAS